MERTPREFKLDEFTVSQIEQCLEIMRKHGFTSCSYWDNTPYVDDIGNEMLVMLYGYMPNVDWWEELEALADTVRTEMNDVVLTCEGDHVEVVETPIRMNCSVIFPITYLK